MYTEEQLQAAIKEAAQKASEATEGLVNKNRELLAELKAARKGQEIKPEELDKLQAKIDGLENENDQLVKQVKEQAKSFEKVQADLQAESGFTSKLLLDNGLTEALVKAGVATPLLPAVKALLSSQAKVVTDGENRKAMIGEKDLTAFITDWAASDEGKHYISAPQNTGGGANVGQGNNNMQNQTVKRSAFDEMSHTQRVEFAKSGGEVTD